MKRSRRQVRVLTDGAEARLQEAVANDPHNPEPTDERLAQTRPFEEVLPDLYAALARQPGRPKAEVTKVPVKLRLDPDVLAAFKATGAGWQTRMNETLKREARKLAKAEA